MRLLLQHFSDGPSDLFVFYFQAFELLVDLVERLFVALDVLEAGVGVSLQVGFDFVYQLGDFVPREVVLESFLGEAKAGDETALLVRVGTVFLFFREMDFFVKGVYARAVILIR